MKFFGGSLNYVISICNALPVFDRNLGYYSQDRLEDNGQLLPWNKSTSGLQQSRLISRISSCRILLISNSRIIIVVELWRSCLHSPGILVTDCNISLLPARPYFSAEYPKWRAMTGSGDNASISCKYCCRSQCKHRHIRQALLCDFDRQYYWRQQLRPLNKTTYGLLD